MNKPKLLETSQDGATIRSYEIEGGKTTFHHFLGCYKGSCEFYNTKEQARTALKF